VHALADGPIGWRRDALARLGELLLRRGSITEARRVYDEAGEQWLAHIGQAELHLGEGDAEGAVELAERALHQLPPSSPKRAGALEVAVRARLARGEPSAAAEHTAELRHIAEAVSTTPLLATAQLCEARVAALQEPDTAPAAFAAAVAAFERAKDLDLPERLIVVLEAGQMAGGDKRGRQSAAVKVYWKEDFPYLDLRVDEHRHPVAELRRIFEVARHQLLPFVDGMPSRKDPLGSLPEHVTAMLLTPPPYRPSGGGSAP
jgi:tetratricopeptide (TPR) repeat protein